jgi:hypothetical protein
MVGYWLPAVTWVLLLLPKQTHQNFVFLVGPGAACFRWRLLLLSGKTLRNLEEFLVLRNQLTTSPQNCEGVSAHQWRSEMTSEYSLDVFLTDFVEGVSSWLQNLILDGLVFVLAELKVVLLVLLPHEAMQARAD